MLANTLLPKQVSAKELASTVDTFCIPATLPIALTRSDTRKLASLFNTTSAVGISASFNTTPVPGLIYTDAFGEEVETISQAITESALASSSRTWCIASGVSASRT